MSLVVSTRPGIGPGAAGLSMTPDEFDGLGEWDENYKYELIHGVLVVTPPPPIQERDPNEELGYWLRSYRDNPREGSAMDATVSEHYLSTNNNRRRVDRVIWAGIGHPFNARTTLPVIVVEFVSIGRRDWLRDYVEKRVEYLTAGIREYWIIDRFRRILTVYQSGKAEVVLNESGTYRTPLLPGFELPLGRLLALADRWIGQHDNED